MTPSDTAQGASPDPRDTLIATLTAKLDEARAVLQDVEWSATDDLEDGGYGPYCPICDRNKADGVHAPDCRLAAALRPDDPTASTRSTR